MRRTDLQDHDVVNTDTVLEAQNEPELGSGVLAHERVRPRKRITCPVGLHAGTLRRRIRHVQAAVARRFDVELSACSHRLRSDRGAEEVVRRALPRGDDPWIVANRFRSQPQARFFFDADDAERVANGLGAWDGSWRARVASDADRVCAGRYRLLGADELELTTPSASASLPWHEDRINNYRWDPRVFYRKIKVPYGRADIKVPWELSRCQHLVALGIAFNATGERRYQEQICAQIDNWLALNPYGYGVNWACTMDVAIRAMNWLCAFRLISRSTAVEDTFVLRLLASLVIHGRHIENNIEYYADRITTNHTLANYAGLYYLGLLVPDLTDAARWYEVGRSGLLECMESQIKPDGVHYENSIAYHRLVLEMFLACHVLAERNKRPFPECYRRGLEEMLEFVAYYTRPDGLAPMVGDSDDGRLHILSRYFDWDPHDHRYLLLVGARLFEREDLERAGGGSSAAVEEAAWLLASVPADSSPRHDEGSSASRRRSRAFRASGRYIMRADQHYVLVCADEVGTSGLGNHKHNDLLSFELSIAGVPIVVDPGSYVYTSDLAWRDRFRSTRAHSTVMVDGAEQNEMAAPFGMRSDATVHVTRFDCTASHDVFEAAHTGYLRLPHPVTHRRNIVFSKTPFLMLVVDTVEGSEEHIVESRLHLAPGSTLAAQPPGLDTDERSLLETAVTWHGTVEPPVLEEGVSIVRDGVTVGVFPFGWGQFAVHQGSFSPRYGKRVACPVLMLAARVAGTGIGGYVFIQRGPLL